MSGDLLMDVRGADVKKLLGHGVLRQFRRVAFPAGVGQVKLPQAGGHDLRDGFRGGPD